MPLLLQQVGGEVAEQKDSDGGVGRAIAGAAIDPGNRARVDADDPVGTVQDRAAGPVSAFQVP